MAGCGTEEPEPTTRVIPAQESVQGRGITDWTESWYHWMFAVPASQSPTLVLEADCATGQSEPVFLVPVYDGAKTYQRSCNIPAGKPVLVPLWVIINDYPCPDSSFEPAPGQSLEAFLTQGAMDYNSLVQNLTVSLDGVEIDPAEHRHTTGLFQFTAERSLIGQLPDACLQGTSQPGVSDGWWLMLTLAPGSHEVHVTGVDPSQEAFDYRYTLVVGR
ncbi:hypothetical protein DAT35_48610 [Vitiosangium sp. GDMCC 1.1324]|nr:hypothetical protein DAT35_48610 [Vitiosangium sp. GDMCC 1.1324]